MKPEKRRRPEENTKKRLTKYYESPKAKIWGRKKIDKLIEKETEELLRKEL